MIKRFIPENQRWLWLLVLMFLYISGFAQTHPVVVRQTSQMQLIGTSVAYLKDTSAKLTLHDILKPEYQQRFQNQGKVVFNSDATNAGFWFKFVVKNETNEDLWLKIGDNFASWYLDFYTPVKGDSLGKYTRPKLLGALRPQQNREFPSHFYCVRLAKEDDRQTKVFYLRAKGNFPKVYTFQVGTTYALTKHLNVYEYIVSGFVALILSMLVYNAFIWYSTRDKIYLYYILALLGILMNITFDSGYPLIHHPLAWKCFFLWHGTGFLFICLFAVHYLELAKNAPKVYYFIVFLMFFVIGVFPILGLLTNNSPVLMIPYQIIVLLFYSSLLFTAFYLWSKGLRNARFYVWGWSFVIVGVSMFIATINGVLPFSLFTHQAMYFGFGAEALVFALALGDRLNTLKLEKEVAQAKNLQLVQEQNKVLEEKVEEKTKELRSAYEDLKQNNEELVQTQHNISLQRDKLEKQNKALYRYQLRISQSIEAANLIQSAILPTTNSIEGFFAEHFVVYKPKDIVSGDFYWIHSLDQHKLMLIVADCTGHGVPGAFMTLIGHILLDRIVRIHHVDDPSEVLTRLNDEVYRVLRQEETGNNNGMDATALVIEKRDAGDFQIDFAGAKSRLLYVDASDQALKELKGTRKFIGGFQMPNRGFEKKVIYLTPDSILYLGSDGLADQNDIDRKKIGTTRLKQLLISNAHLPLAQQKQAIVDTLAQHMEGTEQRDDILWMGIKL
ncbi:7TM diverse intracellular signaling domain-containing protein [uncultured Microscilla sp.]|uniref:7TM diverse intracellular signaling domain-containing protein n=1 Tax=uncultured Microscilla sp. TaxID=432653 RepID=UPI00262C7542|nr:7TM diverse intracellular signaling domain-containing protein [uncultured Microscilla sp.]